MSVPLYNAERRGLDTVFRFSAFSRVLRGRRRTQAPHETQSADTGRTRADSGSRRPRRRGNLDPGGRGTRGRDTHTRDSRYTARLRPHTTRDDPRDDRSRPGGTRDVPLKHSKRPIAEGQARLRTHTWGHAVQLSAKPMFLVHAIRAWRVMPRAACIILHVMLMG